MLFRGTFRLVAVEDRPLDAYWSAEQTAWATDAVIKTPASLAAVYPGLVRHGLTTGP